jgi:molecular chaperone GrpE
MATEEAPSTNATEQPGKTQAGGASEKAPTSPEAELKAQVDKLSEEKRDLNDRLLRLAAEYENYKRRARKDQEDAAIRGLENLVKELLPAMDNFDRALTASKSPSTTVTSIVEGVQMVQKGFFAALEKSAIKPFEAEGKPFDPNFHEAIGSVESSSLPANHVATVFQRGYMIGSRLLRPALVQVSRKSETPTERKDETPNQAN